MCLSVRTKSRKLLIRNWRSLKKYAPWWMLEVVGSWWHLTFDLESYLLTYLNYNFWTAWHRNFVFCMLLRLENIYVPIPFQVHGAKVTVRAAENGQARVCGHSLSFFDLLQFSFTFLVSVLICLMRHLSTVHMFCVLSDHFIMQFFLSVPTMFAIMSENMLSLIPSTVRVL